MSLLKTQPILEGERSWFLFIAIYVSFTHSVTATACQCISLSISIAFLCFIQSTHIWVLLTHAAVLSKFRFPSEPFYYPDVYTYCALPRSTALVNGISFLVHDTNKEGKCRALFRFVSLSFAFFWVVVFFLFNVSEFPIFTRGLAHHVRYA